MKTCVKWLAVMAVLWALFGCAAESRWIKMTRITVPKKEFVYEETFMTHYPKEPAGWPD